MKSAEAGFGGLSLLSQQEPAFVKNNAIEGIAPFEKGAMPLFFVR
jgi:hypothetical protein